MFNFTTIVGLLLLAVTVYFVAKDKAYVAVTYAIAPIVAAFILGFNMTEIVDMFSNSIKSTMGGLMLTLAFVMPLFRMFAECGMFDVIGYHFIRLTKGNTVAIYMGTYLLALLAFLSGSLSSCYIVAFGAFLPVYKQLNLDPKKLLLLCGCATATLITPWNSSLLLVINTVGADPMATFMKSLPVMAVMFILTSAVAIFMGIKDGKKQNSFDMAAIVHPKDREDKPLYRLKLFWVNLILFIAIFVIIVALRTVPQWVVFMAGLFIMAAINYPTTKDARKLFTMTAPVHYNLLIIFLSLSVFSGIMTGTGIVENFVSIVINNFPAVFAKNMHIIIVLALLPICQYVPYQVYIAMTPFIAGVGSAYGVDPGVLAILMCTLVFSTCTSPVVSTTYLGCDLAETEMKVYQKFAFPITASIGAITILISTLMGWLY